MGVLKNKRHELVAQLHACGESAKAIAEAVGFSDDCAVYTVLRRSSVVRRVSELFDEHRKRNAITVDSLLAELDAAFRVARRGRHPNAMVQATLGKAKLLGMLTERYHIAADVQVRAKVDLSGLGDDDLRYLVKLSERLGGPSETAAGRPHRN